MAHNTRNKKLQANINNFNKYFEVNLNDESPFDSIPELKYLYPINDCVIGDSKSFTNGGSTQQYTYLKPRIPELYVEIQDKKSRLISQVLQLQNTLNDLSQRVETVKGENINIRSENNLLSEYLKTLMSDSSFVQIKVSKTKQKCK